MPCVTPPMARASSGVFASSDRKSCHSWPSMLVISVISPISCRCRSAASSVAAGSGLARPRPPTSRLSGSTVIENGPFATACLAVSAMRTSAD